MVDINSTIPLLEPLSVTFQSLVNIIQIVVGGIFGLYLIMVAIKIFYYLKFNRIINDLKNEIRQLTNKISDMDKKLSSIRKK